MTRLLAATLLTSFSCALAVHLMPPEAVANNAWVPPSFDIAMPAQQEPADNMVSLAALD